MALSPRNRLIACLLLAGFGLALFFSGEYRDLGLPLGWIGTFLFVVAVWFCVDALHRIPHSEEEAMIAPGEWQAWIGLAFASAILVSCLFDAQILAAHVPIGRNPDAAAAGRGAGTLFVAWLVLAYVLDKRWAGRILADERDARIGVVAGRWGRVATAVCVIGVAVMLSFSDTERLQRLSYPLIGHMLMLSLLCGWWFDELATALMHWRDRRGAQA